MSEELKACPFCGSEAYMIKGLEKAGCSNNCCIYERRLSVKDWNTRPIEDALRKQLDEYEGENKRWHSFETVQAIVKERDELQRKLDIAANAIDKLDKLWHGSIDEPYTAKIIMDAKAKIEKVGVKLSSAVYYPVDKNIPIYHGFKWGGTHVGVDWIIVPDTDVPSIKNGKVIEAAMESKTYGGYCLIEHDDGFGSLYAHLSKLLVKKGDVVKGGDIIGLSGGVPGTPGAGASTGYHLHFEIRPPGHLENNHYNVDPIEYIESCMRVVSDEK